MTDRRRVLLGFTAAFLVFGAGRIASAQPSGSGVQTRRQERIYRSEMMTEQEREQ